MKTKILLFFCITAAIDAAAAVSSVSCSIEPQQIRIGEHVSLHYEFNQQPGDEVSVPLFSDTVVRGVELVENAKFDTLELKDGLIQVNMDLIATSFDSGFYYIPAMPFACNGDTLLSRALGLSVNTVEVNPDMDDVKDIKPVMNAPFSWQEFFTWSGIALAVIAGLAIIAFVLIKYVFKKKVPFISKTPEPQLPPHEEALLRLQQVKDEVAKTSQSAVSQAASAALPAVSAVTSRLATRVPPLVVNTSAMNRLVYVPLPARVPSP